MKKDFILIAIIAAALGAANLAHAAKGAKDELGKAADKSAVAAESAGSGDVEGAVNGANKAFETAADGDKDGSNGVSASAFEKDAAPSSLAGALDKKKKEASKPTPPSPGDGHARQRTGRILGTGMGAIGGLLATMSVLLTELTPTQAGVLTGGNDFGHLVAGMTMLIGVFATIAVGTFIGAHLGKAVGGIIGAVGDACNAIYHLSDKK